MAAAKEIMLSAQTEVKVTLAQARAWFLSLKIYPERYQFATHEGFEFIHGDFGEVGARFKTREKFFFLRLELPFELTGVDENAFQFRLLRLSQLRVWGVFSIHKVGEEAVRLSLDIGSGTGLGRWLLRFYPVAAAVQRQIEGEVRHIRASMEEVYS